MDKQTYFEQYLTTQLRHQEDWSILKPLEFIEDWKVLKSTLIKIAISMLPKLEKQVIRLMFTEGLTEEKTAKKLKISRAKVHRTKWKAINQLYSSPLMKFLFPAKRLPLIRR